MWDGWRDVHSGLNVKARSDALVVEDGNAGTWGKGRESEFGGWGGGGGLGVKVL